MSYAVSGPLQTAVYQRLSAHTPVTDIVGSAIFDEIPVGNVPDLYISLGPENVLDASDKTGHGAVHRFSVSIVATMSGFQTAKTLAGAVCDALIDATLPLSRGRLVGLSFDRGTAKRIGPDDKRQIDMRFRARVEDQ